MLANIFKYFLNQLVKMQYIPPKILLCNSLKLWANGWKSLLKRLRQAAFYSLMADECTDITTVKELSIYCRWVEDGLTVEHILDIIPLTKADAKIIYTTLVDVLRAKDIPLSKLVGMGFDGAATFSGKRNGVQSLLKKNSPHA